jgi:hypothetical protein
MPECAANTNPAAIFSAGNTFAVLWTRTINPNSRGEPPTSAPRPRTGYAGLVQPTTREPQEVYARPA